MNKKIYQYRIDSLVLNFIIIVILITLASFGYKYYYYTPSLEVWFEVEGKNHRTDELIQFKDFTAKGQTYEWDFGDKSDISNDKSPVHVYKKPGTYTIKLTVNNISSATKKITILEKNPEPDKALTPNFSTPANIITGKPVTFTCTTRGASSWEWRFGETGKADAFKRTATYTYKKPGKKTICLIIDGNHTIIAKRTIYVKPKPRPRKRRKIETPASKKIEPYIPDQPDEYKAFEQIKQQEDVTPFIPSDQELIAMLMDYTEGKIKAEAFEPYLCSGVERSIVKADHIAITFKDFLEDIKDSELRIKEFVSIRKKDECIVQIDIKYRKFRRKNKTNKFNLNP